MAEAAAVPSRTGRAAQLPAAYEDQVKPLLRQYCYPCHGDEKQKAHLNLEEFSDAASVHNQPQLWAEVLRKLRNGEMPPENQPQPGQEDRQKISNWINAELFPVDCDHPDPGRVTIRRLNRVEYNNTIRDLVGVTFKPADDFPADDTGYGFDNIGDVLSVSPLLMEKYLAAASKILDAAIVTPEAHLPAKRSYQPKDFQRRGGGSLSDAGEFVLFSDGEASVTCNVPKAGTYRFKVLAYGQQAGPEKVRMGLRVEGQEAKTVEVIAPSNAPEYYELTFTLAPGRKRFTAAFLNDYYDEQDPNPSNRDRNLVLQGMEIVGPLETESNPLPETHVRIFSVPPGPGTTNASAQKIIASFAERAFRRPVSQEEVKRLEDLSDSVRQSGGSFELSIKVALQAVLISPNFLFRGELQRYPNEPAEVRQIDEYALASRLSYFLWSSMPDAELLAMAGRGRLRNNLEAQVRRMIADAKSDALVDNFAGQWLQTRMLREIAPDPAVFPGFDEALRHSMAQETEVFFRNVLREDRNILDFLTADYSYVDERLARHYGIANVKGPEFRRVSLQGTGRGGVMTHAGVLTLTSNATRTSPVKRGKWVLENLLAQAPPPPPANVPPLEETKAVSATASLRQRMERHREDPTCASCHALMDPIGFALENFDGIGAWRERDGSLPIDPAGKLNTGETFSGPSDLKNILLKHRKDQFVRCLSEKMLTYALGRGLEYYDRCAIDRISADVARHGYRFSALIQAVVQSRPFQMTRGDRGSP